MAAPVKAFIDPNMYPIFRIGNISTSVNIIKMDSLLFIGKQILLGPEKNFGIVNLGFKQFNNGVGMKIVIQKMPLPPMGTQIAVTFPPIYKTKQLIQPGQLYPRYI